MKRIITFLILVTFLHFPCSGFADLITSTEAIGPAGMFHPLESVSMVADGEGRFDFAGFQVDSGITVDFDMDGLSSVIDMFSSEDIVIHGVLDAFGADLILSTPSSVLITGEIIAENILISGIQVTLTGNMITSDTVCLEQGTADSSFSNGAGGVILLAGGDITLQDKGDIHLETGDLTPIQGPGFAITEKQIFPVPEPATSCLLLAGFISLGIAHIRFAKR